MPSGASGHLIEPDGTPHVSLGNDPLTRTCMGHDTHHMVEIVMMMRRGGDNWHVRGTRPRGGGCMGWKVRACLLGGWSLEILSVKDFRS